MEVNIEFSKVEITNFKKSYVGDRNYYSADFKMSNDTLRAEMSVKPQTKEWWMNVADNVKQLRETILAFEW